MEVFNEKEVFYGELILSEEIIKNVRCELTVNNTDTENNVAEISLPNSINVNVMNDLHIHKKIIFKATNHSNTLYLESSRYSFHSNFTWESSLLLYPNRVIMENLYSEKEIKKVIFRAFISPSELLFNESVLTFHESKGLLSGWNNNLDSEKSEWSEDYFKYQSQIGIIELIPAFLFKELNDNKYKKEYYSLRQLVVYCTVDNFKNIDDLYELFMKELGKMTKALSFLFVKRFNCWYREITTIDVDNYPSLVKRIYIKSLTKAPLKDNRFIYGEAYASWRANINKIIDALTSIKLEDATLFDKLLDRYLVAFTYEKIDTKIIYALSCLDLVRNSFKKSLKVKQSFTPNLIDVCETNNIEWLDLFPYLTKSEVFNKKIKKDMYLNKVRNNIIHHGIYPANYTESNDEILRARALSERFILKLLNIDYHSTGLGVLTRY